MWFVYKGMAFPLAGKQFFVEMCREPSHQKDKAGEKRLRGEEKKTGKGAACPSRDVCRYRARRSPCTVPGLRIAHRREERESRNHSLAAWNHSGPA